MAQFQKETSSDRAAEYELAGLDALRAAGARVPEASRDGAVLYLQRIETGGRGDDETFGRELAELHRTTRARSDGWGGVDDDPDAFLGACPVDLPRCASWFESYVERRVRPLTEQAVASDLLPSTALHLVDRLEPEHLGADEPPTLVHGDLWAGNRLIDRDGRSWLIDPAAQWGHRELDIAMMHLFGGFSAGEIRAYDEALPLADGWRDRIPTYQLLPLVVHTLLFGGGYASQTLRALEQITA